MVDYRKTLPQLNQEWSQCEACELGKYRKEVKGKFVVGEGTPDAILLIGEGPGKTEEASGRPFIGDSGAILRRALKLLNMSRVTYITNAVACRSCAPAYDSEGRPTLNRSGDPVIRDKPPSPTQLKACLPRLQEEIYLVDPVIIVTLGGTAAETVLQRSVGIVAECGKPAIVEIPGAAKLPQLTEKRQQWIRRVKGARVAPMVIHDVQYVAMPDLHPSYVLRTGSDKRQGNSLEQFLQTLKMARDAYCAYMREVFGIEILEQVEASQDAIEEILDNG